MKLSNKERDAIDNILEAAERELFGTELEQTITTIDEDCKTVWPDWNPTPPIYHGRVKSKETPKYKSDYPLFDGSPPSTPRNSSPSTHTPPKRKSPSKHSLVESPVELIGEVDYLKDEVQELMMKIKSTVSPNSPMATKTEQIIKSINSNSDEKDIIDDLQPEPSPLPPNIPQVREEDLVEPSPVPNAQFADSVFPKRTKAQTKAAIAQTQREIKIVQQENLNLRKQLKELKSNYRASQKEIANLKEAIRRSEDIRRKMTSNFAAAPKKNTDRVHNF